MTKCNFLKGLIALAILLPSTAAYAGSFADNFCIVPLPMEGIKGICLQEKWRCVTAVTVFDNSPHSLFFSQSNFDVWRLDGYHLVPVPVSELPYNQLYKDDFLTDSAGKIYAKGPWKVGARPILKMDPATGTFVALTSEELQNFNHDSTVTPYRPKYEVKLTSPDREIVEKDYKRYIVFKGDKPKELERIYGKPNAANTFSPAWVDLAGGQFVPFLNDYLVFGRKETKSPINALHSLVGARSTKFLSLDEPKLYRLDLDKFVQVEGSEILKFGQWQEPVHYMQVASRKIVILPAEDGLYYYGADKKLRKLEGGTAEETGKYPWFYDMPELNKVLMRAQKGLFKLDYKNVLVPIKLPPELIGAKIYHMVEMPRSSAVAIFTDRGTYILDENDNLLRINEDEENPIRGNVEVFNSRLIPVRDEVFVDADGEFMVVDKRISKSSPCP